MSRLRVELPVGFDVGIARHHVSHFPTSTPCHTPITPPKRRVRTEDSA